MRRETIWGWLAALVLATAQATSTGAEPDRLTDEQTLRGAGLSTEGPKLLDFLRQR